MLSHQDESKLPKELRSLVKQAVGLLGEVIQHELGEKKYQLIEGIRRKVAGTRELPTAQVYSRLNALFREMRGYKPELQIEVAHAFTLMLEVMNSCENAYRTYRLAQRPVYLPKR